VKHVRGCPLGDRLIAQSLARARENWIAWRDVFEHRGPVTTNPLLADQYRFRSFLAEYYVNRTVRKGEHDKLRAELCKSARFQKALQDDSGRALERLEHDLRPRFGSNDKKGSPRRIVSVLSKVAAFVRPERFVAWDRFARKGLNIVRSWSPPSPFNSYSEYLVAFDTVWKGLPGKQIRAYVARKGVENTVDREPRFLRRVLDMYLMKCGGRSF